MKILYFVVVILIVIALLAFFYKIYLQVKITNPSKKPFVFSRIFYVTDFLPMRIKYRPESEIKMRKKANLFLGLFYFCLIIVLLLSLID
jgi:hypothetical protein